MSDPMSSGGGGGGGGGGMPGDGGGAAGSLGLGLMQYISAIQANKNARAQNATTDKWGPLLALNTHGGGAGQITVPKASFSQIMGPALVSAMSSSGGPSSMPSMGGGGGSADFQSMPDVGGEGAGGDALGGVGGANAGMMFGAMAHGGQVPKYSGGGGISSVMSLLPMLAMLASNGGGVPGQAKVPGDSPENDTQLVAASPGEVVLPRTLAKTGAKTPWKVAAYLNEVKKHGPGPMPPKSMNSKPSGPKGGPSVSPWSAMCNGGMTR
jgi:hypothetical protein